MVLREIGCIYRLNSPSSGYLSGNRFCVNSNEHSLSMNGDRGSTVVKVLCYKSEGRWFDSRWCHWHNPSDRTMALGSTQPLTEMGTRSISWG